MFIKCLQVGPIATNCYLLCDKVSEKAAIVDPGADAPRILTAIEEMGCVPAFVILTHGHADHMFAAYEIIEKTGAKLAVMEEELPLLNNDSLNLATSLYGKPSSILKPDIILKDGSDIILGGEKITAVYTPGHTHGSCCLVCGDMILSGDTLFNESAGRTDFPTGNVNELIASLHRLFALEGDYKVLPGHGEFTTLDHERKYNPYIGSNINDSFS